LAYLWAARALHPNKPALLDEARSLTYATLAEMVRAGGSSVAQAAPPNAPVAVLTERSALQPAAFWCATAAGCPYVPLDVKLPAVRLAQMLSITQPAVVLADEAGLKPAEQLDIRARLIALDEAFAASPDDALLEERRRSGQRPAVCGLYLGLDRHPQGGGRQPPQRDQLYRGICARGRPGCG